MKSALLLCCFAFATVVYAEFGCLRDDFEDYHSRLLHEPCEKLPELEFRAYNEHDPFPRPPSNGSVYLTPGEENRSNCLTGDPITAVNPTFEFDVLTYTKSNLFAACQIIFYVKGYVHSTEYIRYDGDYVWKTFTKTVNATGDISFKFVVDASQSGVVALDRITVYSGSKDACEDVPEIPETGTPGWKNTTVVTTVTTTTTTTTTKTISVLANDKDSCQEDTCLISHP